MPYTDSHRLFVQAIISRHIIPEAEAKLIYDKVCEITCSEQTDFAIFISQINKSLEELDYSLRRSKNERTGTEFLTMVNIKQDKMSELASNYSPAELKFCRELFEAIVNAENENYAIHTTKALRLGHALKFTNKDTQDIILRLIDDGWLAESDTGVYFLDTRALAELQGYLRDQYSEAIKECTICLDVITMGEYCELGNCPVRLHTYCADSQFREAQNPTCPQCSTAWSRLNKFGLGIL